MANQNIFLELTALQVQQPLGTFYVVAMSAGDLLQVAFSEPLKYVDNKGNVKGSQRKKDVKRLKEIGSYIDSVEMAFPNTIILAANYTQLGLLTKDETERWRIEQLENSPLHKIIIPRNTPLAAIIDGQHRLNAFEYVQNKSRFNDLQLVCSVYFDLPNSYQAFLFATINSNQKKVDRSLALEQFGYNVEDEPENAWTPEKLSVFLSRRLNIDADRSPLYQHIKVAPLNEEALFEGPTNSSWYVSTATIVDGINSLISSNPKRDRVIMQQHSVFFGRKRELIRGVKDASPLRDFFIQSKDQDIYDLLIRYFSEVNRLFWMDASEKSYINKTVGVQALFDILKIILLRYLNNNNNNPSRIDFSTYLSAAANINFSDKFFQASGIGRNRIKNVIGLAANLIAVEKMKASDLTFYTNLLAGKTTVALSAKQAWDDEAENAVLNTLEKVQWNYDSKSVALPEGEDFENIRVYRSYRDFVQKLREVAKKAYDAALPDDVEFANQQKENFDIHEVIIDSLVGYEQNLSKLGWNAE